MSYKIALTYGTADDDYSYAVNYIIKHIEEKGYKADWKPLPHQSPKELIKAARGYDAVITGGEPWNGSVLKELSKKIKIVARAGIGYDSVDLDAATNLGIAVTNAPGKNANAVAELALGLILSIKRNISNFDCRMKSGQWWQNFVGTELAKKTVGIVGFGNIGQNLAKLLQGFSCKILAYDKYFNEERAKELSAKYSELDKIFEQSDVVSIHLPLTNETKGIIDWNMLSKMKSSAYLINTSRGPVINEADLIKALKEKIIIGAGLDVFEKEPISKDNELLKLKNVVLIPHMASITTEAIIDLGKCAADNIIELFNGKIPSNTLNPDYVEAIKRSGN